MLKRIIHKAAELTNRALGSVPLMLEKKGWLAPLSFSFFKKLQNAVKVEFPYPVNFEAQDKPLFAHYTGYSTADEQVFELHNVFVSREGIVFSKGRNFLPAFPHFIFRAKYGWLYQLRQKRRHVLSDQETYVLIHDFWSAGNYYHWLADSLPRLWIMRQELAQKNYTLLLPDKAPGFIQATLSHFNIRARTYIDSGTAVFAKRLLVPYYLAGSGHLHPPVVRELQIYLTEQIHLPSAKRLVYVSRGRQQARRVANEAGLLACMTRWGFETVYFEDYSFEAQISLAKNADVIVSSHGANLTNILFMRPDTKVLELIRRDKPNFCYWALCNAAEAKYYYQLCDISSQDHLQVDLDILEQNLKKLLHG